MFKGIKDFICAQWHDVKGNAKWDFIKWAFKYSLMIPAAATAIFWFVRRGPFWEVLVVFIAATLVICFLWIGVIWLILNKGKRGEKQFTPTGEHQKQFTKMVDLIKQDIQKASQKLGYGPILDPAGALILFSNEIKSEDELAWYCNEFSKNGHGSPFYDIETWGENIFQGQWLPVLREARHQPQDVKNQTAFLSFLAKDWSKKDKWLEITNKRTLETIERLRQEERKQKAAKATEVLTKFAQDILNRITTIQRIHPNDYRRDDAETLKIISNMNAYMDFSLKQEAWQAFEEGVADIHGVFLHPGEGATRYEDAHMQVIARLDRRYTNLKKIVENIDEYIK